MCIKAPSLLIITKSHLLDTSYRSKLSNKAFFLRSPQSKSLHLYKPILPPQNPPLMASIYRCATCGTDLNLSTAHIYPPNTYFEAGNKNTVSFSWIDESKFRFTKEDKIMPFFETKNYWGIQRKRTKINCDSCNRLVGYVYDDGPPVMDGIGQLGFGPSQVIPRLPRYRFKIKELSYAGN